MRSSVAFALLVIVYFALFVSTVIGSPSAVCVLRATKSAVGYTPSGTIKFNKGGDGFVSVGGSINGLIPNSLHGFHVHEFGDIHLQNGTATGAHYDPNATGHHAWPQEVQFHHAGDMGNATADANGVMTLDNGGLSINSFPDMAFTGQQSMIGRAVILHSSTDKGNTEDKKAGDAGSRDGQCVIGKAMGNTGNDAAVADNTGYSYATCELIDKAGNYSRPAGRINIQDLGNGQLQLTGLVCSGETAKFHLALYQYGDLRSLLAPSEINGAAGASFGSRTNIQDLILVGDAFTAGYGDISEKMNGKLSGSESIIGQSLAIDGGSADTIRYACVIGVVKEDTGLPRSLQCVDMPYSAALSLRSLSAASIFFAAVLTLLLL